MIVNITLAAVLKKNLFTIHTKSFDEIFLEISFIEKMRTTWGNIHHTGVLNLVAPLLLPAKIYLIPLTFVKSLQKVDFANFLHNIKQAVIYFTQKLPLWKLSRRINNVIFNILQEMFQSYSFLKSQKFQIQSCQWYGVKRIEYIFVDKGICGTRFWAPVYYLR